jgi:hypothetical protein
MYFPSAARLAIHRLRCGIGVYLFSRRSLTGHAVVALLSAACLSPAMAALLRDLRGIITRCPRGHGAEHLSYVFRSVYCEVCDVEYQYPEKPPPEQHAIVVAGDYERRLREGMAGSRR